MAYDSLLGDHGKQDYMVWLDKYGIYWAELQILYQGAASCYGSAPQGQGLVATEKRATTARSAILRDPQRSSALSTTAIKDLGQVSVCRSSVANPKHRLTETPQNIDGKTFKMAVSQTLPIQSDRAWGECDKLTTCISAKLSEFWLLRKLGAGNCYCYYKVLNYLNA